MKSHGQYHRDLDVENQAGFLSGSQLQVNIGSRPYAKLEQQRKCCFGWSKTKICCCACLGILAALILAITVVCLLLFVFDMGDKSGEAQAWEEKLKSNTDAAKPASMAGSYILVSYDKNYRTYLETMGIPWYVVPIILAANEKFSITELGDNTIQILTETSIASRNMTFKFGDEFSMEYGKGMGIMHNVCTRETPSLLICKSEERERNWNLLSKMEFSEEGVVNTRTFVTKNITAKKYYKRELDGEDERKLKEGDEEEEEEESWADEGWEDDDSDW